MNLLRNVSIGVRLGLGFAVILLFSMLITGISVWRLHDVATATRTMMELPLAKERYISDWYAKIDSGVRRTTAIARSSDTTLGAYFAEEAKQSSVVSGELQKKIEALISSPEEKELFRLVSEQRKVYLDSRAQVSKLKADGQEAEAEKAFQGIFVPGSTKYLKVVNDMLQHQRASIDTTAREIDDVAKTSRNLLLTLAVLALGFGVVCAWLLTTGIVRPLRTAVDIARKVADGDLTAQIDASAKDETGQLLQALKDMNTSLLNIVSEVRTGTDSIATSSTEIAAGNQDLSSRTEEQAGSLEETASSMEELTSTVKQNADNARQANQLAASAAQVAVKGGEVVAQVVGTMESINEDRRHHFRDRRHRLPDEYPGPERGRGSGQGRRTGPRLCRRGVRSAQPGPALGQRRERDQDPDRRVRGASQCGQHAGGASRFDHDRHRCQRAARERHHHGNHGGEQRAKRGHRRDQPRHRPDGCRDATECGAGGRVGGRRRIDAASGA